MNTVAGPAEQYRHVVFPGERAVEKPDRMAIMPRHASPRIDPPAEQHTYTQLSRSEHAFLAWLFSTAGLDIEDYKPETLARRLPACLRAVRAATPDEARSLIASSPAVRQAALSTLVIGVTHFFRNEPAIAALAGHLPSLSQRLQRPLRIWSAGCSDGAELYTVAMLLAEAGSLAGCELLGSDVRADAIDRARAGVFDDRAIEAVPPALRARHFSAVAGRWLISNELRSATTWRTANVLTAPEEGPWDIICCRNMAIYLRDEAVAGLWHRLESALGPGGLLLLGKAERPHRMHRFSWAGPCLFRYHGADDGI